MKRRILFISYPFPPLRAMGAVRAWHIARHLSLLGWQITVLTPFRSASKDSTEDQHISRICSESGIRRVYAGSIKNRTDLPSGIFSPIWWSLVISRILFRILKPLWIDANESWLFPCLQYCGRIKPGEFDLILATGSPFTCFIAATKLADRINVPCILDFRDPWSLSPFRNYLTSLIKKIEKPLLEKADKIIMVSPSLAKNQQYHFSLRHRPEVIYNGFDPKELELVKPMAFEDFAVVYAGSIPKGLFEIDPVLRAIRIANKNIDPSGRKIRLHYYGNAGIHVKESAVRLKAERYVVLHGSVPRGMALAAVKGSDLTIVIAGMNEKGNLADNGVITGKIYEPIGMGIPILVIAPEGSDVTTIIGGAGAGRVFCSTQIASIADWIVSLYNGHSVIRYKPPMEYSWPFLTKKLDLILKRTIIKNLHNG